MKSIFTVLVVALLPFGAYAHSAVRPDRSDLIPFGLRSYDSPQVLKIDLTKKAKDPTALRLDKPMSGPRISFSGYEERPRRQGIVPVILSLFVPGAGEIYMGYYKRGAALISMEAIGWTGFAIYRRKGLDTRSEYEHFADVHWNVDRWLEYHPYGPFNSIEEIEEVKDDGDAPWGLSDAFFYMPFISKQEDKQEYYENIGKYNWFISGWDDWNPEPDPVTLAYIEYSRNRAIYMDMREKSNNQLTNADRFIYLSIVARAYSLIETIILSRRNSRADEAEAAGSTHFSVETRGLHSTRFVLEYRFK